MIIFSSIVVVDSLENLGFKRVWLRARAGLCTSHGLLCRASVLRRFVCSPISPAKVIEEREGIA